MSSFQNSHPHQPAERPKASDMTPVSEFQTTVMPDSQWVPEHDLFAARATLQHGHQKKIDTTHLDLEL